MNALLACLLALLDGPMGPADRFTATFNALTGSPVLEAGDPFSFHGTFSLGLLPDDMRLLGVQIRDRHGAGGPEALAMGVDWAVAHGAKVVLVYPAKTFEGGDVPVQAATAAVERAVAHDVLVVTSAGNLGQPITRERFPLATVPGVLVVGGLGRDGKPFAESNRGPQIGLRARAERVCSTYAFGLHAGASCTSWAGPPVATAAARLRTRNPGWSAAQTIKRLEATARAPYHELDEATALQ